MLSTNSTIACTAGSGTVNDYISASNDMVPHITAVDAIQVPWKLHFGLQILYHPPLFQQTRQETPCPSQAFPPPHIKKAHMHNFEDGASDGALHDGDGAWDSNLKVYAFFVDEVPPKDTSPCNASLAYLANPCGSELPSQQYATWITAYEC